MAKLSVKVSEEIRRSDVPVMFLMISFTCLPDAVNRAMCVSVILMKGAHERAVLFIQTQRHLLCGGWRDGKAAQP
jgi:hypothetical protein